MDVRRPALLASMLLAALVGTACTRSRCPRACAPPCRLPVPRALAPTGPAPAPARAARDQAVYTADGIATTVAAAVQRSLAADVDVFAFGELHGDPFGAAAELAVLEGLAAGGRPLALAMEFLERDVQPIVDAWLAGDLDDEAFVAAARQGAAYARTHGPLLAFAKDHGIPVIAANAPRPLVTRYRKSDDAYATWLETLTEEERATLPRSTHEVEDTYRARFMDLMGPERGASFFRSQSLWDDAMAEAIADFREAHPRHRVLFIVGAFHVTGGLGTLTKYAGRRPGDRTTTLVMTHDTEAHLPWRAGDAGLGDTVLKVRPEARQAP